MKSGLFYIMGYHELRRDNIEWDVNLSKYEDVPKEKCETHCTRTINLNSSIIVYKSLTFCLEERSGDLETCHFYVIYCNFSKC